MLYKAKKSPFNPPEGRAGAPSPICCPITDVGSGLSRGKFVPLKLPEMPAINLPLRCTALLPPVTRRFPFGGGAGEL